MKTLEDIDINLLLLLDWLLREKSVTRAAQRMGVTQPAASRSLQKLREIYGDELLIRTGRHYTLSKLAVSLQRDLAAAIIQLRAVARKEETFVPEASRAQFVIACNDYMASLGARAWQDTINPLAPMMSVSWRPLDLGLVDALASGDVDLILAPYVAIPNTPKSAAFEDLVLKPLFMDRFVLFAGPDHDLMSAEAYTIDQFSDAHHILVSPQGSGEGIVDRKLRELGYKRKINQRTWSFNQAAELALLNNSVVVLPERLAKLYTQGHFRPLPFEIDPLPSFVAWHASRTSDVAHRWIRNRFRAHFDSESNLT